MWRVKSLDAILATAEKKSLHRSLGAVQLTLLGVGAIIGTGIFVLTAEAAQKAGPGMMLSFVLAGAVCAVAALCYSEFAAMAAVPSRQKPIDVSRSAWCTGGRMATKARASSPAATGRVQGAQPIEA
mgnify:CR=1 FL=1